MKAVRAEWIVLGSGCFAPEIGSRVRHPSGYALRLGDRETLIFDLGFGDFRQLFRAGIDPSSISHVFFTHRHPDHVGDLPALLFYLRERPPKSGRLKILGPRGFERFLFRLSRAHHPWMGPRGFRLDVSDLEDGDAVVEKGWRVRCREVPHSTESVAYRFDSESGSVCYSGDTGFYPGLAAFAREADLFVLECSLADRERNAYHLRVSEAVELFRASGAKRGIFSHFTEASYRELMKRRLGRKAAAAPGAITRQVPRERSTTLLAARDLMRVSL